MSIGLYGITAKIHSSQPTGRITNGKEKRTVPLVETFWEALFIFILKIGHMDVNKFVKRSAVKYVGKAAAGNYQLFKKLCRLYECPEKHI